MLVAEGPPRVTAPRYVLATVAILLLAYPVLTLTVAGAVNSIFFVLFLISVVALLRGLWPCTAPSQGNAVPPQVFLTPTGDGLSAVRPWGRSQGNAGPSQVFLPPTGAGLGAARPWGRPAAKDCSTDPLSTRAAWIYFLSMAALPIAVFMSQWANQRWGWPYYDAVSRFLLSTPIFFALRKYPPQYLLPVWPGLILGAFAACGLALWFPHNWGGGDGLDRIGSSFVNPIHFGDIALTMGVLPVFGLGWRSTSRPSVGIWYFLFAALSLLAGIYASILSGSRGGWVAMPVFALLAYCIHRTRLPTWQAFTGAFALLLLAILTYALMPEIHHRINMVANNLHSFDQGNENTSIGVRFQLWKAALLIFAEHPIFGVGMGGFKALMEPMQQAGQLTPFAADFGRQEVHSELLSRLSQLGIVGLAAIMVVYLVPSWLFLQRLRASHPASRASARMGLALVCGFFVYGLTVETFDLTMTAAFYALTVAVLLAAAYPQASRTDRPSCSAS